VSKLHLLCIFENEKEELFGWFLFQLFNDDNNELKIGNYKQLLFLPPICSFDEVKNGEIK